MEIFTSLTGRKKQQEERQRQIQPQFQQGQSSLLGKNQGLRQAVLIEETDAFVAQLKTPIFKVEVTFYKMVQLFNTQARCKTQVPALLLELGLFLHTAQQITREFARVREHFLARHSENWSKSCYPKVKTKTLQQ